MARHPTCNKSSQRKAARSQLQQPRRHLPQVCHTSPPPDASTASGGISWHQHLTTDGQSTRTAGPAWLLPAQVRSSCSPQAPHHRRRPLGGPRRPLPRPFCTDPPAGPPKPLRDARGGHGGLTDARSRDTPSHRATQNWEIGRHHIARPKNGKGGLPRIRAGRGGVVADGGVGVCGFVAVGGGCSWISGFHQREIRGSVEEQLGERGSSPPVLL